VDSAVWIDFFSPAPGPAGKELRRIIEAEIPFALTGAVVTEIVQGLTRDARSIESDLSKFELLEPQGFATCLNAADIFRTARSKGISLWTIDAFTTAIALEHNAAVFTLDKGFSHIGRITNLQLHEIADNRTI
jgi:predicted nucleic acid-binding protein